MGGFSMDMSVYRSVHTYPQFVKRYNVSIKFNEILQE